MRTNSQRQAPNGITGKSKAKNAGDNIIDLSAHRDGAAQELEFKSTLLDNCADAILVIKQGGRIIYANNIACKMLGYTQDELLAMSMRQLDADDSGAKNPGKAVDLNKLFKENSVIHESNQQRKDGTVFPAEMHSKKLEYNGEIVIVATIRDVSERQKTLQQLQKTNNTLNSLVSHAPLAMFSIDMEKCVTMWNPAAEQIFGWKAEEVIGRRSPLVTEETAAECESLWTRSLNGEMINGHTGTRVRKDGTRIEVSFSTAPLYDELGRINGLMLIASDISDFVRAEEEIQETLRKLRRTFDGTVFALASLAEKRDPYTAGHQERVAAIATSIAQDMNLTSSQVEGIRVASLIHDIGKVSIPAEILTKPSRLTDIEFNLIKYHSLHGYEILSSIDFPWPVAQSVLQHHERINGSGYPLGLTSEQILPEAKIIAIADVVEAMASHRPYRASLGINAALAEIEKNKGHLYDQEIANVCLDLFRKKGFELD